MKGKLYNRPKYYDIAFSCNTVSEIKLFRKIFKRNVPFQVRSILEPACGSGRFLARLPEYGYHITGYDNNSQRYPMQINVSSNWDSRKKQKPLKVI